jgi:hypothetical protein
MSNINVQDLVGKDVSGCDLLTDSESFIHDLTEDQLDLRGGNYEYTLYWYSPEYDDEILEV